MARAEHIPDIPDTGFAEPKLREQLTKIVIRLLDEWDLKTADKLSLLGLRKTSRNMLLRYRSLDTILPNDQDKLERAGLLLAIYKNLHDLYPENPELRRTWIQRNNALLDGQRPLDLMLANGLFGLADMMRFLDLQKVV